MLFRSQLETYKTIIEEHYSEKAGHFKPMDMEWAKDGQTGQLFIVQARPETVASQQNPNELISYILDKRGTVLTEGASVGSKIATGPVHIIKDVKDINKFKEGEVLVTEMTDPDWEPIMKKAAAIVTNSGGRTCHAAIISRELGVPCVVGTSTATEDLKKGGMVTISCAEGERGFVYKGKMPFTIKKTNLKTLKRPRTKIMMNVGNPEEAFELSFTPSKGVGLAREEFIINSYIKIHPKALINYKKLTDKDVIKKINKLYDEGNIIKFFTARGNLTKVDWREITENQLKDWGVKYHSLIFGKPFGDIYIDDRMGELK